MLKIKRKLNAIIAIEVILTMTLYYFIFVGVTAVTYALDVVKTNHENIDISAYFMNKDGEKVDKLEKNIDQDEYLYVEVSVKNEGYFNGNITLSNNNFNIKQDTQSPDIDEISGNTVKLKQINAGTTKTIKLGIEAKKESTIKAENLNAKTSVELQGKYVNSKNIEKDSYIEINGKTEVEVDWKSSEETKNELSGKLLTNKVYQINEENKRIVQFLINNKITNNNYPVKNTNITLNVPDDVEDVKVHTRYTNATNKNLEFNENNYKYDKSEKKVTINLANDNQEALSWEQNAEDEIVVTYILAANKDVNNQEISLDSTIETYDNKVLNESQIIRVDKEIDGVITSDLETEEKSIYKGKIYTGEDRDYRVSTKVNIDCLNTTKEITIKGISAKYLENETEQIANIIYKQTEIDKNEFLKIFGEDGYITIKDSTGTILANINKDTEANEEGKIVVNYQNNINDLTIQTSNPVNLGILNIKNIKTIKNANYVREEINSITGIKELEMVNRNSEECKIELKETESKANIKLDTTKISTLSDNQTLTVDATLLANDESEDLYKNPNVVITFPKELEVTSVQYASLYKNGLEVENATYYKNDNNQTEVNIQFVGEQTNYDISGGTRICLKAEVKTGKLTPSQMTEVQMKYTNEYKNMENTIKTDLKLESQYGLMLYNKLLGYNQNNESIETIDKEPVSGKLDINASGKNATLQTALINNYENQIQNITLIGKIPSKDEGENTFNMALNGIGTNNNNVKIYYSDNLKDKQSDDEWSENSENAKMYKIIIPTMEPGEVLAIKTDLGIPDKLKANESGNILEDVTYEMNGTSQSNSSKIIVKTGDKVEEPNTTQNVNSNVNVFNNQGLDVKVTAQIGNNDIADGDAVKEGETIKYNIKITNNTGKDYSDIDVKAVQKNGYVWDTVEKVTKKYKDAENYTEVKSKWYEITENNEINLGKIESLKNGSTYECSYESSTYLLSDSKLNGTETFGTISLENKSENLSVNVTTQKNNIESGKIKVNIYNSKNEGYQWVENGSCISNLQITNISNETLKNIYVKIKLSKELSNAIDVNDFVFSNKFVDEDNSTGELKYEKIEKTEDGEAIVTFSVSELKSQFTKKIALVLSAKNMDKAKVMGCILAQVTLGENEGYQAKFEKTIYKQTKDIQVSMKALRDGKEIAKGEKLNNNDIIDIVSTITNNEKNSVKINSDCEIDELLELKSARDNNNKNLIDDFEDNTLELRNIELNPGQSITITVTARVDGVNSENVINKIVAYDTNITTYVSEQLEFLVNTVDDSGVPVTPDNPNTPNAPDNPNTPDKPNNTDTPDKPNNSNNSKNNKYNITGTVWVDEDKNGKIDFKEKRLSQIKVSALNTETNEITSSANTDSTGNYELNLSKGKYIIVFFFDNQIYTTTTYKVNGSSEDENSDAIEKQITLEGEKQTVGATDILEVNSNLTGINIGLVNKQKFDLGIEKYVSKIIIKNNSGTHTYEQKEGTTLAKAEIKSKYLKGSLVVIEYKFKITNNGEIEGYAKNISDNLPTTLEFNSSMNSDWYKSGANLYNSSLANTIIKPGESKEITLTLTKTMTESNTGLINNKSQIVESSNTRGIENINQNTGSANVIISVSTGTMLNYIAIVLIIFAVLSCGAYLFIRFLK